MDSCLKRIKVTIVRTLQKSLFTRFMFVFIVFAVYTLVTYLDKYEVKFVERHNEGAILVEYEYINEDEAESRTVDDMEYDSLDNVDQAQYNYRYRYLANNNNNNKGKGAPPFPLFGQRKSPKYPNVTRVCTMPERLDHLRRYCDRDKTFDDTFEYRRLLVDEKHRLLYCPIPRAASTSWKTLLARSTGNLASNISWPPVHNGAFLNSLGLKYIEQYAKPDAARIAREYYKMIVVRHPYDRLVSAWRDRLVVRNSASRWTLGTAILAEYRDGSHYEVDPEWNDTARFDEFVRYLKERNLADDIWKPYADICDVCAYRWNAILRVETSHDDIGDVLRLLGGNSPGNPKRNPGGYPEGSPVHGQLEFLHSHQGDLAEVTQIQKHLPEMERIRPDVVEFLRDKYEEDFAIFGYEWNPYERMTRCAITTNNSECC